MRALLIYKRLLSIIILVTLIFQILIFFESQKVEAGLNPSSGWEWVRQINISNPVADYQIKLRLYKNDPTRDDPANGTIDLGGKCKDFPNDIRFGTTNNSSTATQLPQWIEGEGGDWEYKGKYEDVLLEGHSQGYTYDGTYHYYSYSGSGGSGIKKYDSNWNLVANNSNILNEINQWLSDHGITETVDHIGDMDYYNGYIYATTENNEDYSYEQGVFVKIDPSNLSVVECSDWKVWGASHAPGLTIKNDIIYVPPANAQNIMKKWNLSYEYIGSITLSTTLSSQGVTIDNKTGNFIISVGGGTTNQIKEFDENGNFIRDLYSSSQWTFEGLDYVEEGSVSHIRWVWDKGTGDKYIYYLERENYADIWIKLPSPAQNSIYLFVGNSNAAQYSDGDATFLFFDDFDGTSLDTSKWTKTETSGTITVSGGTLIMNGTDLVVRSLNQITLSSFIAQAKAKYADFDAKRPNFALNAGTTWPTNPTALLAGRVGGYDYIIWNTYTGTWGTEENMGSISTDTYYLWHHIKNGASWSSKLLGTNYSTIGTSSTRTLSDVGVYIWFKVGTSPSSVTTSQIFTIDYVFARKYTSPEPSWSSFGEWQPLGETREWKDITHGWSEFSNLSSWKEIEEGYVKFAGEGTWQNLQTGWVKFSSKIDIIITNIVPETGSTIDTEQPTCSFTLKHTGGKAMNYSVYWAPSNDTQSMSLIAHQENVTNGTYYFTYEPANIFGRTWWWKLVVDDGNIVEEKTFNFTLDKATVVGLSNPLTTIWFFIALIAIVLMFFAIRWQSVILSFVDGAVWFTLALLVNAISIPFVIQKSGSFEFGNYTVSYPFLSPIFWGLGTIVFVYGIYHLIDIMIKRKYGEFY